MRALMQDFLITLNPSWTPQQQLDVLIADEAFVTLDSLTHNHPLSWGKLMASGGYADEVIIEQYGDLLQCCSPVHR